jgi:acetolactate synthase-1/2/3 large subunit
VVTAVEADPVAALDRLHEGAAAMTWRRQTWGEEVLAARRAEPADWGALRRSPRRPMHPLRVCAALQPLLVRGAILVADGGEFGPWAQAGLEAEVRLINGLSGSIGGAVPMACEAKLARPERDGGHGRRRHVRLSCLRLDTALRWAAVLTVVGNDARCLPSIGNQISTTAQRVQWV